MVLSGIFLQLVVLKWYRNFTQIGANMNLESLGGTFAGIYTQKRVTGAVCFYIKYKDEMNVSRRIKVGESPEMTKSKARVMLQEKKQEITLIKQSLKGDAKATETILTKRIAKREDPKGKLITLNDFADFYFKQHGSKLKNLRDNITRYDYHLRSESIAQKPIQLITRDDLAELIDKKKEMRSDKRASIKNGKTLEEKELEEYQANLEEITKLESIVRDNPERDNWREKNQAQFLIEKNRILALRASPTDSEKLLKNKSISEDDKREMLGLLSMKSIKEIILSATTIVNYGIGEKDLNIKNPFSIPRTSSRLKIHVNNIKDRFLTREEVQDYLDEIKLISENPKHKNIYLMALLALSIAGRQNTILTIKISDINFQGGTIQLRNHKTEKWYFGSIGNETIREEMDKIIDGRDEREYLFVNYTGERPLRYPRIMGDVLDYTVNYKKEYLNWLALKDFRNTAASHMAMNGIPLAYISKVLNHSSIVMTERYAHLLPDSSESVKSLVESYNLDKKKD